MNTKFISSVTFGVLAFGATACSTQQAPREVLGAAKMAVIDAEKEDQVTRFAPAELDKARQKVTISQEAIDRKNYIQSRRLSEQAIVDAQLAQAKTEAAKAGVGALEVQDAAIDLQREIRRNQ